MNRAEYLRWLLGEDGACEVLAVDRFELRQLISIKRNISSKKKDKKIPKNIPRWAKWWR